MINYDVTLDNNKGGETMLCYCGNILLCMKRNERKPRMHQWRLLNNFLNFLILQQNNIMFWKLWNRFQTFVVLLHIYYFPAIENSFIWYNMFKKVKFMSRLVCSLTNQKQYLFKRSELNKIWPWRILKAMKSEQIFHGCAPHCFT